MSCSVRWTSKSDGASRIRAITGRRAAGRGILPAAERIEQRAAQVEVERIAELVRLGRLVALPSPPVAFDPMTAERVALEPCEEVVEDLLADPPAPAWRQLEPLAVAGEVAGLLEPACEVVERIQLARRLVAEQVAHLVAVDGGEVGRRVDIRQGVLEAVHRLETADLGQGTLEPERLVAAERDPIAETARQEQVEVGGELGKVDQQPVVTQERLHHRPELGALLRAHRPEERLHGGHPLCELVDDVVERPGAREEPAVLGEEPGGVGFTAADPLADELVEVAHHLPVGGQVLRGHRPDRVGHPRHELVENLALQPLDELVEPFARIRLEEVVVLEAADPLPDVGRQAIELVEPPRGDVPEHRAQVVRRRVVGLRGVVEPPLDARSLLGHDLVELAPDVAQDVVELVALEHRLALSLEPVHQVAQPRHVAAGRVAGPPAPIHQSPERLGEVALGHDVVRERVEDLVGLEVGHVLAAVPGRVAGSARERIGGRLPPSHRRPGPRALRPQVPRIRGVRRHRW